MKWNIHEIKCVATPVSNIRNTWLDTLYYYYLHTVTLLAYLTSHFHLKRAIHMGVNVFKFNLMLFFYFWWLGSLRNCIWETHIHTIACRCLLLFKVFEKGMSLDSSIAFFSYAASSLLQIIFRIGSKPNLIRWDSVRTS